MTVCACAPQKSTSCKSHYLTLFQCVYHHQSHCYHLVTPAPLLLVNRGPRGAHVAHMRARRQSGSSLPVNAGELHCIQSACVQCMSGLAVAVKDFYDMRSEWAGSFTMTPLSIVPVERSRVEGVVEEDVLVVDVRYLHVGGYEDIDHRRFTVQWRGATARQQQQQHHQRRDNNDEKAQPTPKLTTASTSPKRTPSRSAQPHQQRL